MKKSKVKSMKHKRGFTLMELMIVIVIMGILIALGLSSYTSVNRKNRDNRRKNNLRAIATVLESYYTDKGKYPNDTANGEISGCSTSDTQVCAWNAAMTDSKGTVYMQKLPGDPASTQQYYYDTSNGNTRYQLYARLENTQDSDIPHDVNNNALTYPSTDCSTTGSQFCNYGVASTNTMPETGRTPQ